MSAGEWAMNTTGLTDDQVEARIGEFLAALPQIPDTPLGQLEKRLVDMTEVVRDLRRRVADLERTGSIGD